MVRLRTTLVPLLAGALLLASATAALGDDPGSGSGDQQVVVTSRDGEKLTLGVSGGRLTVISNEDGKVHTAYIDLSEIGNLVEGGIAEALSGLDEVLAELGDSQLEVRLGNDNRINLSYDDSEFELDLDQIMTQVADAVEFGLAEIDIDRWCNTSQRGMGETESELRQELQELQAEMKELRRELRRLQAGRDH